MGWLALVDSHPIKRLFHATQATNVNAQRFPCRRCNAATISPDAYVICTACLAELEQDADDDALRTAPVEGDVAASIRRLLDDW